MSANDNTRETEPTRDDDDAVAAALELIEAHWPMDRIARVLNTTVEWIEREVALALKPHDITVIN